MAEVSDQKRGSLYMERAICFTARCDIFMPSPESTQKHSRYDVNLSIDRTDR